MKKIFEIIKKIYIKFIKYENGKTLLFVLKNNKKICKLKKEEIADIFKFANLNVSDNNGNNIFMLLCLNNEKEEIRITEEEKDYVIKNTDLKYINPINKKNCLHYVFENKHQLKFTEEQIDYLIRKSDTNQKSIESKTPLYIAFNENNKYQLFLSEKNMTTLIENSLSSLNDKISIFLNGNDYPLFWAIKNNKKEKLNLKENQWDLLIKNSDLNIQNIAGWTALTLFFYFNKENDINLNENQWNYLIKNSNLNQYDMDSWNPLFFAIRFNKEDNINLKENQWDYLLKNTDLRHCDKSNNNVLSYIFMNYKEEGLSFTEEQWNYLLKNVSLDDINEDMFTPLMFYLKYKKENNIPNIEEKILKRKEKKNVIKR